MISRIITQKLACYAEIETILFNFWLIFLCNVNIIDKAKNKKKFFNDASHNPHRYLNKIKDDNHAEKLQIK